MLWRHKGCLMASWNLPRLTKKCSKKDENDGGLMMMIVVMQNHAKQKLDITSVGKQLMEDNNELCQSQKTKLIQCS